MPPTNSLPGGCINGWEKATEELSHHIHYWQSKTMFPELDNNYVLYNEGEKDWNIENNVYEPFL